MVGESEPTGQQGVFGNDLATMLDPNDRLYLLSQKIPWPALEQELSKSYAEIGRPSLPPRLMAGLTILKHTFDLSDEELVEQWRQNPYWQFFCGESHFRWKLPCSPSEMTRFRKRIGPEGCERILKASLEVQSQRVDVTQQLVIDSTVQEKNITYPTFAKLDVKVIERCRAIAAAESIQLRQSYVRVVARLRIAARNYRHKNPKVRAKARRAERRIRRIAARLLREIQRKMTFAAWTDYAEILRRMAIIVRQTAEPGCERIHSLHEPGVLCLAKGKAHKPYEFGDKVSIAVDPKSGLIVAAQHLEGRMGDRASVAPTLDQVARLTGQVPKRVIADLGYRGPSAEGASMIITPATMRGTTGSTRKRLRRLLRRRQVVEGVIGRMKFLHRMGRNFLKGTIGDRMNVLLAAAGHNFRRWLRYFCRLTQSVVCSFILALRSALDSAAEQRTDGITGGYAA
jgi:IS5 family transposase